MQTAVSSRITSKSTSLKLQTGLDRPRSTFLTMYANGSMQLSGIPSESEFLYLLMFELINIVMSSEPTTFLKTMKRADVT